jgi:carboxymethylenebutenolidase
MCDQDYFEEDRKEYEARGLITRRQFGVLVGAGVSMTLPEIANAQQTSEKDVEIKTPDGTCDAYFVYPSSGSAPAVLIWPDIFGLRPAMRTMGKRLASSGYSVLVVNPFYRNGKPKATGATPIQEMMPYRKGMNQMTDMTDAKAFIAWLDQQPPVNSNRGVATQGYCIAGPTTFNTASAAPARLLALASCPPRYVAAPTSRATVERIPSAPTTILAVTRSI